MTPHSRQSLEVELSELRRRLDEAEGTLHAIRHGEVDALIIGDQVYTLESADAASNRFRGEVLAQINEVVIAIDTENRITYLNPAAERQYEISASEVLGKKLDEILTHQWPGSVSESDAMAEIEAKGSWRGENIHIKRSGEVMNVESTVTEIHDRNGNKTGLLAVVRDITDRKKAEDALRQAHDELESRVVERTIELSEANQALKNEMAERAAAERQRAELLRKVVTTQEDERRRVARDIHDQLGQRITGLRLQLASLNELMTGDESFKPRLSGLIETAEKLDSDVSFLAWRLRPASLDDLGLIQAMEEFVTEWSKYNHIESEFIHRGITREKLTAETETQLYRILQEALNNVAKHADAGRVNVLLESTREQITLIVEDNGIGFDRDGYKPALHNKGLGLLGMSERALLIGGSVEIESAPGAGTTVFVRAPAMLAQAE